MGDVVATDSPASLPPITDVDLVVLDDEEGRLEQFERGDGDPITVRVSGARAQRIATFWRELPPGEQARCHIPPYGLRFHSGGRVVCRATICWECSNIFGDAEGRPLHFEFDAEHETSLLLETEIRAGIKRGGGGPGPP